MNAGRPWEPEVEVTSELATRLITAQFPAVRVDRVSLLGAGWDNTAWLVNEEIVFRFPRRVVAVALLETEARALPQLERQLPVRIPVPEWIGAPSAAYPWPFVGYRRLAGRTGCQARLSASARRRSAPVLGDFLARLHAVRPDGMNLPGDMMNRRDFVQRMPLMIERLDVLRSHGVIDSPDPWLRLFVDLEQLPPVTKDAVVHGDLDARHMLFDDRDRLTGIIDWGDVHVGDPAMDLMMVYEFLPASARAAFEVGYGTVDDGVRHVARLRAAFHAITVTWYGIELPDADLADEGRRAMGYVLEE